jgi:hypothetical protein
LRKIDRKIKIKIDRKIKIKIDRKIKLKIDPKVWMKFGITYMAVPNQLGLTLRHNDLEIRSDIIEQPVFHKQVLPPDVLTRLTIGKYAAGLVRSNNCTNFAQTLLNRL